MRCQGQIVKPAATLWLFVVAANAATATGATLVLYTLVGVVTAAVGAAWLRFARGRVPVRQAVRVGGFAVNGRRTVC